jgi:hypothetical protein
MENDSLEVRLHSFNIKMEQFQLYYEAAKANINIRTYCSWDLSKFRWSVRFSKDLTTALNKVN